MESIESSLREVPLHVLLHSHIPSNLTKFHSSLPVLRAYTITRLSAAFTFLQNLIFCPPPLMPELDAENRAVVNVSYCTLAQGGADLTCVYV